MDLFVHVGIEAAPGGRVEVLVESFGFAAVTDARPLPGATIEAGWDPESLGGAAAQASVTSQTDGEGRARLVIDVPPGTPGPLSLLVGGRHGSHARTRAVKITRRAPAYIELHTADARVVPTSTISAWARVASTSGRPLAGAPIVVSLLEGGVPRHRERLISDRGGIVMARVPIPRVDEPVWEWTLRAEPDSVEGGTRAELKLTPREETPGTPAMYASWSQPPGGALAGDRLPFSIGLRDATGQPLIDQPVRYWIGPKGTSPPSSDDDWEKHTSLARTDGGGTITGSRDAPTLVKSSGTSLQLVARSVVEGRALSAQDHVAIGVPTATAALSPEGEAVIPGLAQRMMLRILDGRGGGIAGRFKVNGDGLAAIVTTDANGEAEVTWDAPLGVGATRNVGPCAGGVAAAVTIRPEGEVPTLKNQRDGFATCVSIDRDAAGIVRVEPTVARPGDKVRVTVHRGPKAGARGRAFSAIASRRSQAVGAWIEARGDGTAAGEITLPPDAAGGLWTLSAVPPDGARASRVVGASFLVVPTVAPLLTVKRVGGRAAPQGSVEIEAQLTDGHGRGLPGAISAIVGDVFGGGDVRVAGLDTRSRLCTELGAAMDRCAAVLEGDGRTDALRRALLSKERSALTKPSNDPGAHATEQMKQSFAEVLRSLEGAVFESTKTPQTLLDVRRKEGGRWVFNPEMFTLVTDAIDPPPTTPGGEKLLLGDLATVDPQVTFDNVAKRVTRLKLFRILSAVRAVRSSKNLDPDEPVFKDPNALLRRMVRSSSITEDLLLDPWGGTIQFVRSNALPVPFLSIVRGFELRAPGPDGTIGTGDDVRDPFERVLRSGSPYASAVEEDRLVDAKWDMVVSEESVQAWQHLFDELTGTSLGSAEMGLTGAGEGGGGRGEGIGLGNIGTVGYGRGSGAIATGDGFWTAPVRTDAEGRVRMRVPLGDAETTWRLAFIGVPDGLEPASTTLDVASEALVSARVDTGTRWVDGDLVAANVIVRNRTAATVHATITTATEGAVVIEGRNPPTTLVVPANGARQLRVQARATQAGAAAIVVTTRVPGVPEDVLRHGWEVVPRGERRVLTQTGWVDGERELATTIDAGYVLTGSPRLVLERGYDDAVAAALDSLEPERQTSTVALVDALDAALRIHRWATTRSGPKHRALADIAKQVADRALGRFEAYVALDEAAQSPRGGGWTLRMRVSELTKRPPPSGPSPGPDGKSNPLCPPVGEDALDAEPITDVLPCWGAYVSDTTRALESSRDVDALARAVLALAERPQRQALAAHLADQLRRTAKLQPSGDIDAPGLETRATRGLVYAALLRAQRFGRPRATQDVLFSKLAMLRDVSGGYGSSSATLGAVRALLASQLATRGTTHVRVRTNRPGEGTLDRQVDVLADGFAIVDLPPSARHVQVDTSGPGLIARFERPVLRSWSQPPPTQQSPVGVEVVWPADAHAGSTGTLRVLLKQDRDETAEVDVRIPLPPGVTLAAPTKGMLQLQGTLAMKESVSRAGAILEAPIRFGLSGKLTIPEATARISRAPAAPATAPARPVVIQ